MLQVRILVVLTAMFLLGTFALAEKPPDLDCEKGSVGVSVRVIGGFLSKEVTQVYFAKLGDDTDPLTAEYVVPSNYSKGNRFYLLNAEPGRYVVVGVTLVASMKSGPPSGGGFHITIEQSMGLDAFFAQGEIIKLEMTLAPDRVVFVGDLDIRVPMKKAVPDEAQKHYYETLLFRNSPKTAKYKIVGGVKVNVIKELKVVRSERAERDFWRKALKKDFMKSKEWRDCVKKSSTQ